MDGLWTVSLESRADYGYGFGGEQSGVVEILEDVSAQDTLEYEMLGERRDDAGKS